MTLRKGLVSWNVDVLAPGETNVIEVCRKGAMIIDKLQIEL